MNIKEFENKCAFLARTPQERWFDLRLKPFISMIINSGHKTVELYDIFPSASSLSIGGCCLKVENKYYFLIALRSGNITECFNVETTDFDYLPFILCSNIILSSDDDPGRTTFLPLLLMKDMTKPELKAKLDVLFD